MSFFGKPTDHEISQLQKLNISGSENDEDSDVRETPKHGIDNGAVKNGNENEIKLTPDNLSIGSRIMQMLNSVHKKPATPDYSRISHHRTCQQMSCRFLRFPSKKAPMGPFFISFKDKPVIIETNYYDQRCRMSFFDQTFSYPRCIGKGSFGEVFKAFCKDDKRWYAVKITVEPFRSPADREGRLREVQKHELLPKHPNLISFVRAWEEYGFLYIQTELCQCSLMDYKMKVGIIPESDLWLFFGDIALAVRYLHSHDLLHLDIKPQNIMVSFDGICKLGDFSLIIDIQKKSKREVVEEGDGKYLAPEVLQGGAHKPSDIFSLGMTMVDICTDLELPTTGDLWQGFRCKRIYHEYIKDVPPALLDVILLLLETDPSERPTAEEICRIPMIAKCIHERQCKYLERNMWWILLTVGYSSLFASSWIVQPARSAIMHAATYLKRMHSCRPRCSLFHHVFRATSDESPMFKNGIIPRVNDSSRLQLKFDDDDDDYKYEDSETETETDSGGKMEMSQSEDELVNVMETSISEQLHYERIEAIVRMDIENNLKSAHDFKPSNLGAGKTRLPRLFDDGTTFCQFGPAGDVFKRNDCSVLTEGGISAKKIPIKKRSSTLENFELQLNISTCETLGCDHELPSTSESISGRPKSLELLPTLNEASPLRDGYITPPSNTTPSPFVCKTPARGRFDDSYEQKLRHYCWWRESFTSPTARIRQEMAETAASNDVSPEASDESEISGSQSFGDPTRRRAYFHAREPSPPAKRAQIDNEDGASDEEDRTDDLTVKKSDTDTQ